MKALTVGQEVEIPGFILGSPYGTILNSGNELPENGYATIAPYTIKFIVPADYNPIATAIAVLEKKLDTMADAYRSEAAYIKNRIAELQCIEMSPEVSA